MNFLNNISIKMKLLLMVIPPLLIITFHSILAINALFIEKWNLETSKSRIQEAESLAKAIHVLQIERGLSVGFTASNGTKNGDKIPDIRSQVDNVIAEIKEVYTKTKGDSSVLNNLSELSQKRSSIDSLKMSGADVGAYYSKVITATLNTTTIIPSLMFDQDGRNAIQAYTHLGSVKEALGQIRANLNGAFSNNTFAGNTYATFNASLGAYNVNLNKFQMLAPDTIKKYYTDSYKGDSVEKTFAMLETAKTKGLEGGFGIDAAVWFTNVTASIDILRNVELGH